MKRYVKHIFLTAFFVPWLLSAQIKVTGEVVDAVTGAPLAGVNIAVEGTTYGTTTDLDGRFTLDKVPEKAVLIFSYLGYRTLRLPASKEFMRVRMQPETVKLEEVVIVGYGKTGKKDLTGAVDKLDTKQLKETAAANIQSVLAGKVAGVNVITPGGAPGEGAQITIRGLSSLQLTNEPLYVVDGIPLGKDIGGSRNILNFINPEDIENIVILKDASATAIYGSRAANGVVIITTKKAKKRFSVSYHVRYSYQRPYKFVPMMTTDQFKRLIYDLGDADAINLLGDSYTDWQKQIFHPALANEHNLGITGKLWKIPVRFSAGYLNQDGILGNDNMKRTTAALSMQPEPVKGLRLEINARGSYTENQFANRGAIGSAIVFDPTQPVYDPNSPFAGYFTWIDPNTGLQYNLAPTNPVALIDLTDDFSFVKRFAGNIKADYDLPFVEGLTFTVNAGMDKNKSTGHTIVSAEMPTSDPGWQGIHNQYHNEVLNKLLNTYFTYKKDFKKHHLKWMAGYSYQSFDYSSDFYDDYAFQHGQPDYNKIDLSKEVMISYYTRLNYKFRDKYLLTATLRADASSLLNPANRWGLFPSMAVAWNIHKEKFMENSAFDELKLRIGYGEVGNVNGLAPYKYLTRYQVSTSTASYQFGNEFYETYRPEPVNKNLRWEIGKTTNIGLDFALWDRRLSGSVNLYKKETKDLIIWALVDPFTNFGNRIEKNVGDMVNTGVELSLSSEVVRNEDLRLQVDMNFTYNNNYISYMPFDQETGGIEGGVGNTVQLHTEGSAPYSFYVYQQVYDAQGQPIEGVYVDRNGDGVINNEDKYLLFDPYADMFGGLNVSLQYKHFDFAVNTRASLGNYMYNNVASSKSVPALIIGKPFLMNIHTDYYNTHFQNFTETNLLSDYYVQDASFFKIDRIRAGYTVPDVYANMDLRFYAGVENVAIFTKYAGTDPEIAGGIDNNFYIRPRIYTFGMRLTY